jgi:Flp pilus assembly protein TadD
LDYEENNIPKAFDHFTSALRYDPRHFEAHFNLAHLYFEAGDFRLARLHYDISAVIEPNSASVHFNLGLIHAINGDLISAIASLNRARSHATEEELAQVEELLASLQNAVK